MEKKRYREYWKMVRDNSREKTNNKLGIGIRILAIMVGIVSTATSSLLLGSNPMTIITVASVTILVNFTVWAIVWIGFFVYYRANESVIIHSKQSETIENLESIINKRASIGASQSQNIKFGRFIFEQIQLNNLSPQNLFSCFAVVESFSELLSNGENRIVEPVSRSLSWSTAGRRSPNNKVDLINGIPEKLFIARVDLDDGNSYLVGEGGNNTPLDKDKSYLIQIRLCGDNFSPHTMKVLFDCRDDGSVKIVEVTNPSFTAFSNVNMGAGKFSIDIK